MPRYTHSNPTQRVTSGKDCLPPKASDVLHLGLRTQLAHAEETGQFVAPPCVMCGAPSISLAFALCGEHGGDTTGVRVPSPGHRKGRRVRV